MSIPSYRTRVVVRCRVCDVILSDGQHMKFKLCPVHVKLLENERLPCYCGGARRDV